MCWSTRFRFSKKSHLQLCSWDIVILLWRKFWVRMLLLLIWSVVTTVWRCLIMVWGSVARRFSICNIVLTNITVCNITFNNTLQVNMVRNSNLAEQSGQRSFWGEYFSMNHVYCFILTKYTDCFVFPLISKDENKNNHWCSS